MAIKKTVLYKEIEIKDAYLKVSGFSGNKSTLQAVVTVQAALGKPIIDSNQISIPYVLDGKNPIAQAYEYLKTLPDFAGAVDC
jgi:hypothetical protein